jgi:hypothetical protein
MKRVILLISELFPLPRETCILTSYFLLLNSCDSALGVLYYCVIGVSAWVQVFLCLYYRISVENKEYRHSGHLTSYLVYGTEGVGV